MTPNSASRVLACFAGLMGAIGMALAAASAHQGDAAAARLGPASTMLMFHACAVLGTVALTGLAVIHRRIGLIAAFAFVVGTALFSGDLAMRHYAGNALFPMAAPSGGTLLIVAWVMVALAAIWPSRRAS